MIRKMTKTCYSNRLLVHHGLHGPTSSLGPIGYRTFSQAPPPVKKKIIALFDSKGHRLGKMDLQEAESWAERQRLLLIQMKIPKDSPLAGSKYPCYQAVCPDHDLEEDEEDEGQSLNAPKFKHIGKKEIPCERGGVAEPTVQSSTSPKKGGGREKKRLTLGSEINSHDLETKVRSVKRWLKEGCEVQVICSGTNASKKRLEEIYTDFTKHLQGLRFTQKSVKEKTLKFIILPPDPEKVNTLLGGEGESTASTVKEEDDMSAIDLSNDPELQKLIEERIKPRK
jgi:translation initiation factor IF-3